MDQINFSLFDEEIFEKNVDRYEFDLQLKQEKLQFYKKYNTQILRLQKFIRKIQNKKNLINIVILQKKQNTKNHIIKELYDTEIQYVECLEILIQIQDVTINNKLLSQEDLKLIFLNIKNIYDFQIQFKEKIINLKEFGVTEKVLLEIKQYIPGFRIYNEYCRNYDKQNSRLNQIMNNENSKFIKNKFYQKFKSQEKSKEFKNLDLESLFVKPCQRFGKYPLLFQDMVKQTQVSDPSYKILQSVLKQFQEFNLENDSRMVMFDKQNKLKELQQKIQNIDILSSNRRFLFQLVLNLVFKEKSVIKVQCNFLNDMIIIFINHECYLQIMVDNLCFIRLISKLNFAKNLLYIKYDQGLLINYSSTNEQVKNMKKQQGCLIFTTESQQERFQLFKDLDYINQDLQQKFDIQAQGQCCYDEDCFIARIKIGDNYQIIQFNYQHIHIIANFLFKQNNDAKKRITNFRILEKLIIILNNLNNNNKQMLQILNINHQFFKSQQVQEVLYSKLFPCNKFIIENELQQKGYTTVSNILKLLYKNKVFQPSFGNQDQILDVYLLMNSKLQVSYNPKDQVLHLFLNIQKLLKIDNLLDFGIHIKIKKKFYKVDLDQTIENIIKLKSKDQDDFIYFYKCIYLEDLYEIYQLEDNKLKLIINQLFYQVKQKDIMLSLNNYQRFMGYACYKQYGSINQFKKDIQQDIVQELLHLIPQEILQHLKQSNLITQAISFWESIENDVKQVKQEKYKDYQQFIKTEQQEINLEYMDQQKKLPLQINVFKQRLTSFENPTLDFAKRNSCQNENISNEVKSVSELRKLFEQKKEQTFTVQLNKKKEIEQKEIKQKENMIFEQIYIKDQQIIYKCSEIEKQIIDKLMIKNLIPEISQYGNIYYQAKVLKKVDQIWIGIGISEIQIQNDRREQYVNLENNKEAVERIDQNQLQFNINQQNKKIIIESDQANEIYRNIRFYYKINKLIKKYNNK